MSGGVAETGFDRRAGIRRREFTNELRLAKPIRHGQEVLNLRREILRVGGASGAKQHERTVVVELGKPFDGRRSQAHCPGTIGAMRSCGNKPGREQRDDQRFSTRVTLSRSAAAFADAGSLASTAFSSATAS